MKLRAPAPSDTTARSASVSAAVSSIISPPTERPMPPMRSGSTSGPVLQVRDGGLDVLVAAPAPGVGPALAAALAAAVEEQHAVAVAGEHARLALRAVAAREGDDRGAVARGDVPALELEPVAGRELHVLVSDAEVVLRHDGSRGVDGHVAKPDHGDEGDGDESGGAEQRTARVAPPEAAVGATGPPQRHGTEADQEETGGDAEQAGEVVARRSERPRVVERLEAGSDAERAEQAAPRPRASRRSSVDTPTPRAPAAASGTRPLTRWSAGPVPGSGWMKLSSITCRAIVETASVKTMGDSLPSGARRDPWGSPRTRGYLDGVFSVRLAVPRTGTRP